MWDRVPVALAARGPLGTAPTLACFSKGSPTAGSRADRRGRGDAAVEREVFFYTTSAASAVLASGGDDPELRRRRGARTPRRAPLAARWLRPDLRELAGLTDAPGWTRARWSCSTPRVDPLLPNRSCSRS